MAPPKKPPLKRIPPETAEFLLLLSRAEAQVQKGLPEDCLGSDSDDGFVQRAKVRACEAALSSRLEQWKGLSDAAKEAFRIRIEELVPTLERVMEKQRVARAPPEPPKPEVPPAPVQVEEPNVEAPPEVQHTPPPPVAPVAPAPPPVSQREVDLPWRQRRPHGGPADKENRPPKRIAGGVPFGARAKLEDEMVDLAEGMKGAASSFLTSLKSDNERLSSISTLQQKSLDKVTAETQKGRSMMWSGQLGFLCTMILLAISVAIFLAMIPFIIVT